MKTIDELLPLIRKKDLDPETVADANWLFKNHVAKLKNDNTLVWSAPDSYINRIDYLLYGNYLIIVGDYGESIFCRESTFEFWAFSDLGYIMSKIQACSENLTKYDKGVVWDSNKAKNNLEEFFKFFASEYWKIPNTLDSEVLDTYDSKRQDYLYTEMIKDTKFIDIRNQLLDGIHSYDEYRQKIFEIQNDLYKAFGDSFYEFKGLISPGVKRSFRIEAQFLGLRLALAQLGITETPQHE
jgi:hypothetical protein